MTQPIIPPLGKPIRLADYDTRVADGDWDKEAANEEIKKNAEVSSELAYRLYAENRRAVLLVLQGMDTSGKDGTIRTVMTGVNPQSFHIVVVQAARASKSSTTISSGEFTRPSPRRGHIGIFNRSHYEDVLVVRVHNLVPEKEWRRRYERINEFEELLADGT